MEETEAGVDTRLKFTIEPSLGKNGFQQWFDALKAVARLPTGIPKEWRKRVWLTLADQYLHSISIDWEKTLRFAFNDRSNPDDDTLGIQIVKDLHRTGYSSYCGQEGEQDRVVLKRVLLAFARWNKAVGYCQGFNVLAALILDVTEGNEGDALKVMIYLIDKVLPESYFANNLRALSVDMAVFRDLLRLKLPELSLHLHNLQKTATREGGGSYEPPLTNVFTMQWFLTMFATCLPRQTVLKIWDSVFFEGSEVLLRVALAIWAKLGERVEHCQSADDFYSTMGSLTQDMLEHNLVDSDDLMLTVYSMAAFPFPQLAELREKYTYNITPFPAPVKASSRSPGGGPGWESDEDDADMDDEDSLVTALGCLGPLGGFLAPELQKYQRSLKDQQGGSSCSSSNMAELSPGAIGAVAGSGRAEHQAAINSMMLERMSTDINALRKQYSRIKRRQQQQANLLYIRTEKCPATSVMASQVHPTPVVNHLFLGKRHRGAPPRSSRSSLSGSTGGGGGTSQGYPVPLDEAVRSRLQSPWRAHVRTHRRNIARARAQLDLDDQEEGEEEEEGVAEKEEMVARTESSASSSCGVAEQLEVDSSNEESKADSRDEGGLQEVSVDEEARKCGVALEQSITQEQQEEAERGLNKLEDSITQEAKTCDSSEELTVCVEKHLAALELDSQSDLALSPTLSQPTEPGMESEPIALPKTPIAEAPMTPSQSPSPTQLNLHQSSTPRPSLDSSSSEYSLACSVQRIPVSASTPAGLSRYQQPQNQALSLAETQNQNHVVQAQLFSPFPCVKAPRKSATARNLGLYGPTSRTPTVYFPHLSKGGLGRLTSSTSSTSLSTRR